MNSRTLKRGLRECGLRRRNEVHSEHEVREMIKREIEGPSSLFGYRAMWNKPRTSYSIAVPRDMVTVYKSLIHRHLPFERQGSCCVDHTSHQVQTQLGMFTDTTNWNLKAYLYMAARMDFPGEYCVSNYVKLKMIPWFKPVFPQCSGRKQTATNVGERDCGLAALQCLLSGETVAHRCSFSHANQHIQNRWSHSERGFTAWVIDFLRHSWLKESLL